MTKMVSPLEPLGFSALSAGRTTTLVFWSHGGDLRDAEKRGEKTRRVAAYPRPDPTCTRPQTPR